MSRPTGKFLNGQVYMIIPTGDLSREMVNKSTSRAQSTMPLSTDSLDTMVETLEPVDDIFKAYTWLDCMEMRDAWALL